MLNKKGNKGLVRLIIFMKSVFVLFCKVFIFSIFKSVDFNKLSLILRVLD